MIVEFLSLLDEELTIRRNQNTILSDIKNIYNEELQLQRNQNTILTDIRDKLCKFDTDNK